MTNIRSHRFVTGLTHTATVGVTRRVIADTSASQRSVTVTFVMAGDL